MKRMILGVGNRLSHDDGAGPAVASQMADAGHDWLSIDCGTSLENAVGLVGREQPDLLILVDAARMGLPPGSVRRLPLTSPDQMLASTHGLPLPFVLGRLEQPAGESVLIGIEPEDLSFGEGLSDVVSAAVSHVVALLRADRWQEILSAGGATSG